MEFRRLFFIETQQILSLQKYQEAKNRLSDTKQLLENIDFDDEEESTTGAKHILFSKMKEIFRRFFISPSKKTKIELVVGSPVLWSDIDKKLFKADGVSCVTFLEDQYVVILHGINNW